jgi:hypothetical protein
MFDGCYVFGAPCHKCSVGRYALQSLRYAQSSLYSHNIMLRQLQVSMKPTMLKSLYSATKLTIRYREITRELTLIPHRTSKPLCLGYLPRMILLPFSTENISLIPNTMEVAIRHLHQAKPETS